MKKSELAFKIIFSAILILYIPVFLRVTFMEDGIRTATNQIRLIPFNTVFESLSGDKTLKFLMVNYLGNILLFIPIGLILSAIFKRLTIIRIVLISLLITVAVELSQNLLGRGYADIDDIMMNVLGAFIGAVIFSLIKKIAVANIITLALILALAVGGFVFISNQKPELLPSGIAFMSGRIAGRPLDEPDVEVESYKMSHGEVFISGGSYYISDTAVFAVHEESGKRYYIGLDDMIEKVANAGKADLKLWLNDEGRCSAIMFEE